MTQRSFRGLFWTLALLGLSIDLASKYAVFRWLEPQSAQAYDLVPGWFKFVTQYRGDPVEAGWRGPLQAFNAPLLPRVNQGALFGIGNGFQIGANSFFALVSLGAAIVILVWSFRQHTRGDRVLTAALGLILGGTLGNLFDRVVFHGVRDFLYFYWIEWPVFNFADCCLVAGACLLLLQALWPSKVPSQEAQASRELVHAES
ncbi:MAG: signal peptidase II [Gemmataceae bacterium]